MTDQLHNGDSAEYCGSSEALSGKRCTVDSWTPKRTRVRAIFEIEGRAVLRSIKPENLIRRGGGMIDDNR